MAIHLFNGRAIFGSPTSQTGPEGSYRAQDEQLPGVDGVRVYRLGRNPELWRIRGRLTAGSLELVRQAASLGKTYVDGNLYNFTDSSGHVYKNCQLMSFTPVGPYEGIQLPSNAGGVTVEVDAVVRWVAPLAVSQGLG